MHRHFVAGLAAGQALPKEPSDEAEDPPVGPGEFAITVATLWGPLRTQVIEASSLDDLLEKARALPFADWFEDEDEDEDVQPDEPGTETGR